jgi:hypothetical protein
MKDKSVSTDLASVAEYQLLKPLFQSFHHEMVELSKKKPDGLLNKLKVSMINKVLIRIKALLSKEPTNEFVNPLDDESLPTNSYAVIILSQFESAMRQFHSKYYRKDRLDKDHRWHTRDNP